ncbi:MAG: hypothetical protein HRU46_12355 [Verrucomicrobiales bacterium]|nr:hypothetical protein [Verrucomicrobiales bacterium]
MDYVDSIDFCEGFFTSLIKGSSLQPVYRHILLIYLFLLLLPHGRLMGQSVQFPIDFMEAERNEAIPGHVSHQDVIDGKWTMPQLIEAGRRLFVAKFTTSDGGRRPGSTGHPLPTGRPISLRSDFVRTAGPDANSCVSCHNRPFPGGGGDFTANAFVGPLQHQPIVYSINPRLSMERGTPSLHGAGVIEALAREISGDLIRIKKDAIENAQKNGKLVQRPLNSKGISFGTIVAHPDGTTDTSQVDGIDTDLVVKPWRQKGTVVSLRSFTVTASNMHHGMQADERFGRKETGRLDFDQDGVSGELTDGDITALVAFQATLGVPGVVMPRSVEGKAKVLRGEMLFSNSKCARCHIPRLRLDSPVFREPGIFPDGSLKNLESGKQSIEINLLEDLVGPKLEVGDDGEIWVEAYTDFKRHVISDEEKTHFANEVASDGRTLPEEFVTKRLWGAGNTAPYGHRADVTSLREVILHHGGDSASARAEFEGMSAEDQDAMIAFLRSRQILPAGSPRVVLEPKIESLPYVLPGDEDLDKVKTVIPKRKLKIQ